mmetsp:Transcript_16266/g.40145  ORF Transcript_16266/g.40145 Transcript_16266/m.40145 type:complete len:411 (-) Transcript_16266:2425-3657(-)
MGGHKVAQVVVLHSFHVGDGTQTSNCDLPFHVPVQKAEYPVACNVPVDQPPGDDLSRSFPALPAWRAGRSEQHRVHDAVIGPESVQLLQAVVDHARAHAVAHQHHRSLPERLPVADRVRQRLSRELRAFLHHGPLVVQVLQVAHHVPGPHECVRGRHGHRGHGGPHPQRGGLLAHVRLHRVREYGAQPDQLARLPAQREVITTREVPRRHLAPRLRHLRLLLQPARHEQNQLHRAALPRRGRGHGTGLEPLQPVPAEPEPHDLLAHRRLLRLENGGLQLQIRAGGRELTHAPGVRGELQGIPQVPPALGLGKVALDLHEVLVGVQRKWLEHGAVVLIAVLDEPAVGEVELQPLDVVEVAEAGYGGDLLFVGHGDEHELGQVAEPLAELHAGHARANRAEHRHGARGAERA